MSKLKETKMSGSADASGGSPSLVYSDGIAAARTMIALKANAEALQQRLPPGWTLAPYAGDDMRGSTLRDANMLIPFHEVYAVRADGAAHGLPQVSYIAFVSQARHDATGDLGHIHWRTYTEDPDAVPGKYRDGVLVQVDRSQAFTKHRRGETEVRETFSAVGDSGELHLSLAYEQGGDWVIWTTAEEPNLALHSAQDPTIVRWYQEDQVLNVVRSEPLNIDRVSEISLRVQGELSDVLDGNERVIGVVIQRPYMRQVHVPNR
jgi:hypothetical protein